MNLGHNDLAAMTAEALGQLLKWNTSLVELELGYNSLYCDPGQYIDILPYIACITYFKVFFFKDFLQPMMNGLGKNTRLKYLGLSFNGLNEPPIEFLANAMANNTTLTKLDLQSNLYTHQITIAFAPPISPCLHCSQINRRLHVLHHQMSQNIKIIATSLRRRQSIPRRRHQTITQSLEYQPDTASDTVLRR